MTLYCYKPLENGSITAGAERPWPYAAETTSVSCVDV